MAVKTIRIVTSDLSGDEKAETVVFGFDGATYEVDLTAKEKKALEKALLPYLDVARKSPKGRRSAAVKSGPAAADVREWAKAQGHEVPERGRIPKEVREAYDAAH